MIVLGVRTDTPLHTNLMQLHDVVIRELVVLLSEESPSLSHDLHVDLTALALLNLLVTLLVLYVEGVTLLFEGFLESETFRLLEVGEDVPGLAASEAVITSSVLINAERGGILIMEGTESPVSCPRALNVHTVLL